ncbi:MAG: MotA/TolQ/ExbB proton channel family protein [Spirochaetales bacterium]|nr:MAG: MotA/TolQ/ExbB proton channel family protein [Spirochaetales bacterium]
MIELMQKGGIVMWIILALSLAATVIIIERLLYLRRIRTDEETLLARLKATVQKGHFDEALNICESNPSPLANIMKTGLEYRHHEHAVIKDAVVDAASLEIPKLERYLPSLGTIAHIAPLLGLLGTVTGNIKAFGVLSSFGSMGDPALLSKGIAEALLTTAAGIVVSIPAIIFYNSLVTRVNHIIIRLENRANELLVMLKEKAL